jgi:hypothetical protein
VPEKLQDHRSAISVLHTIYLHTNISLA